MPAHLAESFTLDDQFSEPHHVTFGEGEPVVVLFADRSCAFDVRAWVTRLVEGFGERVRVVGVAAVGEVPALFHGAVRGFLHGQPSVLLDWGNRVSHRFGYDGGECLLVVVDGAGQVQRRVRGAASEARYAEVGAAVGVR